MNEPYQENQHLYKALEIIIGRLSHVFMQWGRKCQLSTLIINYNKNLFQDQLINLNNNNNNNINNLCMLQKDSIR